MSPNFSKVSEVGPLDPLLSAGKFSELPLGAGEFLQIALNRVFLVSSTSPKRGFSGPPQEIPLASPAGRKISANGFSSKFSGVYTPENLEENQVILKASKTCNPSLSLRKPITVVITYTEPTEP